MRPWMNRLVSSAVIALVSFSVIEACANATVPPGGPPDAAPPLILAVTPKSQTVGAKNKDVEIRFSEVISEVPKGGKDLRDLVFISPRAKETYVDWHRDRITIHPKGGWLPNTTYSVQLSPGVADLRNNAIDSSVTVVFSTGGAIPNTTVTGVAFDWVVGRGANRALIEALAIKGKDTTIYQVVSDSVGRFSLQHAPNGNYLVRAIIDRNGNRQLDPTESFDSLRISLAERSDVEFYTFPHDTVGLRLADVQAMAVDSLKTLKITFDKPLAPGQIINTSQITLKRADSTSVGIALVQTIAQRAVTDSVRKKAREDSIARANIDTSAAGRARALARDSLARIRRADSIADLAANAAREARRLATLRGGRPAAVRDTTPPPKMKRPEVSAELYVTLAERLAPGTPYRIQVSTVRSLSGTIKSPSRSFNTPRPEKKADSTATPTRRPP